MEELDNRSEKPDNDLQRENEMAERSMDDAQNWNKKGNPIIKKTMDKKTKMRAENRERAFIFNYIEEFNIELDLDPADTEIEDVGNMELLIQYVIAERLKKLINILVDVEALLIDSESKSDKILSEIKEIKAKLEK
jgi:hypothetical protein